MLDKTGTDSRSHGDSGFTDGSGGSGGVGPGGADLSEEAIIQQHIARQLAAGHYSEREVGGGGGPPKPDLVAPPGGSPDMYDNAAYIDEPPEHYDIENASSIAPSDLVDVVAHYNRCVKRHLAQIFEVKISNVPFHHTREMSDVPICPEIEYQKKTDTSQHISDGSEFANSRKPCIENTCVRPTCLLQN